MNDFTELVRFITHLHERYRDLDPGETANGVPASGKADADPFGISVATVDGQLFSVGDVQQGFAIQSLCRPLAFLMALEAHGRDHALSIVGIEPGGDSASAIELNPRTRRPFNPMNDSGAIAIASLIKSETPEAGASAFVERLSRAAGRALLIDDAVYAAGLADGHRNRAIAWLLRDLDLVDPQVENTLHQHAAQGAVLVNSADLAMIGATLANLGQNPVTRADVFDAHYVRDALTAMFVCGMPDCAGEWALRVGMPAAGSASGATLAVVNRRMGIAVYSPRVDAFGSSARATRVCADLAEEFGLHAFDSMNGVASSA